ncbi:hypothetical protein LTR95_006531 [Oleoguttula sp. CCFEE 5521]
MASVTTSSLTEGTDNLTELHKAPGLQNTHQSSGTKTGFLVHGDLLAKYEPTPPSKRPKISWVWKDDHSQVHGEAIIEKGTKQPLWLCNACYNRTPKLVFRCLARPTTAAQRHMVTVHNYNLDGTSQKRKHEDDQNGIDKMLKAQSESQA